MASGLPDNLRPRVGALVLGRPRPLHPADHPGDAALLARDLRHGSANLLLEEVVGAADPRGRIAPQADDDAPMKLATGLGETQEGDVVAPFAGLLDAPSEQAEPNRHDR